ncbi:Serine/threonine-protein kinase sepA [Leucoagaricus sp. SymC.cos]|nr:Serine/threonine-protein kinase sepA [Leucoagaricus sp. SymC.cos]
MVDFLDRVSRSVALRSGKLTQYTQLLDDSDIFSQFKKARTLSLFSRLVESTGVFPKALELKGVQCDLTHSVNEGGSGLIYKGIFEGKTVCVKAVRVHSHDRKDILSSASEVIIWTRLSHANILPIRGIYIPAEKLRRLCMVSEWMDNGDLVRYLTHFPDTPRIPLLHDIISGLRYLHGLDIVHADLKASSVLVSETGRALLVDFGLSQIVTVVTATTITIGGTVYWMAPEQLISDEMQPPTPESDVWSFGCVCYEVNLPQVHDHSYC